MKLNVIRVSLAVVCLGLLDPAANADFATSFDSSEGYTTGDLPGQQGWVDMGVYSPTGDVVVSAPTHTGDQALIPGGRTKHSVNGPLTGNDVDMQASFYYGEDTDAYWWDLMSSSGTLNARVTIARDKYGPEGDAYYIVGQGGSVPTTYFQKLDSGTWYDVKMRFLWDGVSSYDKYDLWIDGEKKTGEDGFDLESPLSDISDVITIYANTTATYSAYSDDLSVTMVPEPAALSLLLAAGISVFVALSLRGKRS